jgi:hypothetical protein
MEDDVITVGNEMIFTPYNSKNKEISLNDIQTILLKYGVSYPIQRFELYKRAFVHSSYCTRNFDSKISSILSVIFLLVLFSFGIYLAKKMQDISSIKSKKIWLFFRDQF